jgi:hypothetical protein
MIIDSILAGHDWVRGLRADRVIWWIGASASAYPRDNSPSLP